MSTVRLIPNFEFDPASGEIRQNGSVVGRLEPQPAAVLATIASRPGELVTHEDLRLAVWGDTTHVKLHDALHYCIRQIRTALGDTAREPRYIETIPRRGYRMRADAIAVVSPPTRLLAGGPQRWAALIAAAAILITAAVALDSRPNNHHEIAVKVVKAVHDVVF